MLTDEPEDAGERQTTIAMDGDKGQSGPRRWWQDAISEAKKAGWMAIVSLFVSVAGLVVLAIQVHDARGDADTARRVAAAAEEQAAAARGHARTAETQAQAAEREAQAAQEQASVARQQVEATLEQTKTLEEALKEQADATRDAIEATGPDVTGAAYYFAQPTGFQGPTPDLRPARDFASLEGSDIWLEVIISNRGRSVDTLLALFLDDSPNTGILDVWCGMGDGDVWCPDIPVDPGTEAALWVNLSAAVGQQSPCAVLEVEHSMSALLVTSGLVPFKVSPATVSACHG